MCGIVGYIGKKENTLNVLINGLKHLEYRGYDSSGVAYILNNKLIIKKAPGRINNLEDKLNFTDLSNIGIGHTRWATHGKANEINSHPHRCKNIAIVHNGIIENYLDIKNNLIKKGYKFKSETDTEVAAVLLYDLYKDTGNVITAIIKFKELVTGSYAIALICDKEPDSLYVIKKNSPLIIGLGDNANYVASDMPAIVDYTKKYITLADNEFAKITKDNISLYDKNNKEINYEVKTFIGSSNEMDKGIYEHYMLKEIYEEADVIRRTCMDINLPNISNYKKIIIVACGSAMHAGLVGANLIEKYACIPVKVEIASEFRYKKLFLDSDTLVIAISQSGETADTLEAVKIAKTYGSHTLGIINVIGSSIAREVDEVIYTKAGSEIAVATTKAYLAQVMVLSILAYLSRKDTKLPEIKNYEKDLKKLPNIIEKILKREKEYQQIAKYIYQNKDIFYIGRGIDYAICMEASLKIKEISYLHSEAYPAGELKHGTISLIEEGTPVIGLVTDHEIATKTISNLKEVKSRGANVIYITTDKLQIDGDFYNERLIIPDINPLLEPIVSIIPLQLIAYHTAKLNKCDIDKPKNLAKSVTVE